MDPYNNGTPKYSTAQDIYEALCKLVQTEEMNILEELGADVSWDSQTYYYTDKGYKLKEEFEELSDYNKKIWLLELAIIQMDCAEIHGQVYDALLNDDLAKRIGFKKLFIEHLLHGQDKYYTEIAEKFLDEIGELYQFDTYSMTQAFKKAIEGTGLESILCNGLTYQDFACYLADKVRNLRLTEETRLIAECRAHLTAYDDFIFGLRANQALYNQQEQMYKNKVAKLQAAYDEKLKILLMVADRVGLMPALTAELQHGNLLLDNVKEKSAPVAADADNN